MSVRPLLQIALFAGLAGAAVSPAAAQQTASPREETRAFVQRIFGSVPGEKPSSACFVRTYDAAHLAAHPQQKVTKVVFLIRAVEVKEDETLNYSFITGFNKRGSSGRLDTSGSCGHSRAKEDGPITHLHCGVDCDGGGLDVEVVEGNKSILVRIPDGISVEPAVNRRNDDPPSRVSLNGGPDDKVFRLDRVAIEQCAGLFGKKKDFLEFLQAK